MSTNLRVAPMPIAVLCSLVLGFHAHADVYELDSADGGWEFTAGGRPVLVYHTSPDVAKPYIDPLRTPRGHSVTTARPSGWHHHGLWLTLGPLVRLETGDEVDFWSENGDPGATGEVVLDPGSRPRTGEGDDAAWVATENDWRRVADGLVLLAERRETRLLDSGSPRAHLLSITSELTAAWDLVLSHESNEAVAYYGLAVQMPGDMRYGLVVNSHGDVGRADVEGVGARWCACATNVVPARGVAIFDDPGNPRHPNAWFTLDSGFLSTSIVAHEDYAMKRGETLTLRYGVLVFDGDFDRRLVVNQYRRWLRAVGEQP